MKKKSLFTMILIISILGCLLVNPVSAVSSSTNAYSVAHTYIEDAVIGWLKNNYGSHYYLRDIDVVVERTFNSEKNVLKEKLIVTFEKMLKVDSSEKLPYVIGLRQGATTKNSDDIKFLNNYISSLSEYIGTYTNTCIDIVGECSITNPSAGVSLYYQDVYTTTLYPINVLSVDDEKMLSDGLRDVDLIIDYEKNAAATRGYDSYDRIAARDYAQTYTSNDISVCSCSSGSSCTSAKYNTDYWNSDYSVYSHTDCANYSSQAMAEGGIPTDSTWYKDSLAWINSNSLKTYMTTTKGYWDSSTFAAANAGNILRWKNTSTSSARHTVIITLNDTVTHQYSGHTTDRLDCVFYENSNHEYFTIKTNP